MVTDAYLDPEKIRERLKVLIAVGVAPRAIGNRAQPPLSETDISRFKNGAHWGENRLGRLHAALQDFEQQMLPTPTIEIEETDHEEKEEAV
ncbi:hypothetical protein DYH09_35050 [bacterium CPR1]|nr:hypothetical protein [bacterium CPR1]